MKLFAKEWENRRGLGGGPRWRLIEFAEHYKIDMAVIRAAARNDKDFPKPVSTTNHRTQPGGSKTCDLYGLSDLRAWWAKRQQK